jgi:hypothetical protein
MGTIEWLAVVVFSVTIFALVVGARAEYADGNREEGRLTVAMAVVTCVGWFVASPRNDVFLWLGFAFAIGVIGVVIAGEIHYRRRIIVPNLRRQPVTTTPEPGLSGRQLARIINRRARRRAKRFASRAL